MRVKDSTTPELLTGWVEVLRGRLFSTGDTLLLFTPRPAPPELLTGLQKYAERVAELLVEGNVYEREPVPDQELFGALPGWCSALFATDAEPKGADRAETVVWRTLPEEGTEGQQAAPVPEAAPEVQPRPAQAAREMTAGGR